MALTVELMSKEGTPVLKHIRAQQNSYIEVNDDDNLFVRAWGGFVTVRIPANIASLAPTKCIGRVLDRSPQGDTSIVYLNGDDASVDVVFNAAYLGDTGHRYARAKIRRMTESAEGASFES